ncbi:hypothetical protein [Rhizobium laguerreae]|uniref:hypothetical protein n=1 Tax=Rhizobium laguerreae TaxID=1076926 RepID=UPI001FE891E2|nr:hypothetical protein [Rhizobium laguerreae]
MKNELIHEVWLDPEPDGQMLPGLCLAGPMGNDFRALLKLEAVKAAELSGHSHFEAMTKYWKLQDWASTRRNVRKITSPIQMNGQQFSALFSMAEIEVGSAISGRSPNLECESLS